MSYTQLYTALHTYFEQNLPYYLDLLKQMVAINSFTANPVGVNTLGRLTAEVFAGLGFVAKTAPSVSAMFGRHLILTRPGRSGRKVGFISHLDTVFPLDEELGHNFVWRQAGDKIYGPGTNDIKGGTVMIYMILAGLRRMIPHIFDEFTWVVLLDAAEEELSGDFGRLCLAELAGETLACLVFESGGYLNQTPTIVTSRKGRATYRVTVEGKGAHAGSNHREGANAIVQLAKIIDRVADFTDYERELTFNIGTVAGGTVINRVPHFASASVEMRAFTPEVFNDGLSRMLALNDRADVRSVVGDYACRVAVEVMEQIAPWPQNTGSDYLFSLWQAAAAEVGQQLIPEARGGLSDGNWTWQALPTIDGLGPIGDNSHCSEQSADGRKEQEYVLVSSFVPRALLNTAGVLKVVESKT